jgi:hypothetical protein
MLGHQGRSTYGQGPSAAPCFKYHLVVLASKRPACVLGTHTQRVITDTSHGSGLSICYMPLGKTTTEKVSHAVWYLQPCCMFQFPLLHGSCHAPNVAGQRALPITGG